MKTEEYPKITVILRGYSYAEAMMIIEMLSSFDKQVGVEVTTNNPDYLKIISEGTKKFGDQISIGVGTVLN
ncbi:MAG: 2-dehydro-3-deoxyphosphogluconate aldolase, partial [Enterococcus hulanensis]